MLPTPAIGFAGRTLAIADLILLGLRSGAWDGFEQGVSRRLALERAHAANTVSPEQLRSRATAFRYAHGLVSAAEFTTWLRARRLTLDDLAGELRRELLHRATPWTTTFRKPSIRPARAGVARAEAPCGGVLQTLADAAVCRLAAADRLAADRLAADHRADPAPSPDDTHRSDEPRASCNRPGDAR